MARMRYFCTIHGGDKPNPFNCARCYKNARGGMMLKVKCEDCGNEQNGTALIIVLKCPTCQSDTWHYRSDRYEELTKMSSQAMAKLIVDNRHGRRESGKSFPPDAG